MGNGGGLCVCVKRSVFSAIKSWRDERTALQATQTDTHTLSPPPQSFISRSLENNFSESCCSLRNNFAYPSSPKRLHVYVIQMTHQFSFLLKTNLIIISFIFPKIRIRIQLLIYVLCSVATLESSWSMNWKVNWVKDEGVLCECGRPVSTLWSEITSTSKSHWLTPYISVQKPKCKNGPMFLCKSCIKTLKTWNLLHTVQG